MLPKSSRRSGTKDIPAETRRSTCQPPTSTPRYSTPPVLLPDKGNDPITAFKRVDLPAPLAPITVTMLPRLTMTLALATAVTLPYRAVKSVTFRMGCLGLFGVVMQTPFGRNCRYDPSFAARSTQGWATLGWVRHRHLRQCRRRH